MENSGLTAIGNALALVFDVRKLGLALGGVLAILVGAGIFAYLGLVVDSVAVTAIFFLLAAIAGWALAALFSGALSHMCWEELTRGKRPAPRQALGFGSRHLISFMFSPLALMLAALLVVVGEVLVLLLGRIPYLGELFVSIIYLPLVLLNVLLLVAVSAGSWLVYPIIAESGAGVVSTVQRVGEVVRRAPAQLVAYFVIALFVIAFVLFMVVPLILAGQMQTVALMNAGVGTEKMAEIVAAGPAEIFFDTLGGVSDLLAIGGIFAPDVPFTIEIASFLLGLSMLSLFAVVVYVFPWVFVIGISSALYASLRDHLPARAAVPSRPQRQAGGYGSAQGGAFGAGAEYAAAGSGAALDARWEQAPAYTPPSQPGDYAGRDELPVGEEGVEAQGAGPAAASSHCSNCGREVKASSRYCPYCGAQREVS